MFEWDRHNLSKIRAHGIKRQEVKEVFEVSPILIYEQDAAAETRYVYYGETALLRMLALSLTERNGKIRVVTAYDLDAGQKADYLTRRTEGE